MATWADAQDVIDSWIGDDAPTDFDKVEIWVDRAERVLRNKISNLTERVTDEPDLVDNIRDVVSNMVQRVFRNPQGTRQRAETTGPFTESVTYGGDQPGALWVTDDELGLLAGSSGSGKAFSVDLLQGYEPPAWMVPSVW